MFDLHPAIEHIAEKGYEGATLDEMAIVNLMRRSLMDSFNNYQQLKLWLQQENPLRLHGGELTEWATTVAAWVLPEQMRILIDATKARKLSEGNQSEHQDRASSRQASEASSSNSPEQGSGTEGSLPSSRR